MRSAAVSSLSSLTLRAFFNASRACSNRSESMCITTSPNIWINLRKLSSTKRSLPVRSMRALTVTSFKPRLSTVSIMPGMEAAAPLRTDTSRGLGPLPKVLPNFFSNSANAASTWGAILAKSSFLPILPNSAHASVVMVNPGGTGKPRAAMPARFAPLPPSNARIVSLPSELFPPKL